MISMRMLSSAIALALVLGNTVCADGTSPDKFQYYKELHTQGEGLRSFEIDPEIYAAATASASDIRIFSGENAEVQYHKYNKLSFDNVVESNISFEIINRYDDGGLVSATFVGDSSMEPYDAITIDISTNNFLLSPKLSGSKDGINFYPIASRGYIYSFEDRNKGSNNKITFDKVDYKYLKAEFEVAAGKVFSQDIKNASYVRDFVNKPVQKGISAKLVSLSTADKMTTAVIDTGYSNLPVSGISTICADKNFSRGVRVFTGNDMKDFSFVSEERISSFDIGDYKVEKKKIEVGSICGRYIKLIIDNQDSEALSIQGAEVFYLPDNIVFEAESDQSYRVYYGSKAYEAPVYDMSYIADKIDKEKLVKAQLGPAVINPDYKKEDIPFTDRNNYFMTAAIILIVMALGFVIIKNLKSTVTSNKDNEH